MAQKLNTQTSIVDYLKSKGQDSSMSARTQLAQKRGVANYSGTANQNVALLNGLKQKPAIKAPKKLSPTTPAKGIGQQPPVKPNVSNSNGITSTVPNPKTVVKNPVKTTSTATPRQEAIADETKSMEDALAEYKEFLKQQTDSSYDSQKAMLDTQKAQRLADLKKALDRAIADGELSTEEANKQFAENVDAINEDAYMNAQATDLSGAQRGIGNSQQLLAMQQGDQRHQAGLTNDSRTARDDRISSIRQKITQITNENALDVSVANESHSNALLSARAQADAQYASGMSQMNMEQYKQALQMKNQLTMQEQAFLDEMAKMEKQQGYTKDNMKLGQQYELDKMKQGQQYTQDNMKLGQQYEQANMKLGQMFEQDNMQLSQKYTQSNMNLQQKLDLSKMSTQQSYALQSLAKQYGYDMSKMNASQLHEFNIIARQHGYAKEMTGINQSFEMGMQQNQFRHAKDMSAEEFSQSLQKMRHQFTLDSQAELNAYDLAVKRELEKLKPGTAEYKIRQGQLAQEREALVQEQHTATSYDAISKEILEGQTTKPKKPTKSWWEPKSMHDKDMREYEEKLKQYQRYQDYLANPTSALP